MDAQCNIPPNESIGREVFGNSLRVTVFILVENFFKKTIYGLLRYEAYPIPG